MKRRINATAIITIAVLLLVVLVMDLSQMFTQLQQQAKDAGVSQLENISRELEKSIADAEALTMEIAIEAREVLDDREALKRYLISKKAEVIRNETGAFNVYVAGSDWWFIPDFDAPDDYVAQERTWYKGAIRKGGKTYLSSPYQDAMTGDICYTVAVMLGDGESVVAVDYTMDSIQTYVEEIHDNGNSNALIVTDDGIIAGCSNDELIGEQLISAVPEFAGIWSLSRRSDEYVTARIKSDFLYENLFATKSGNGWILIVSVSDWELYKASYIQLIVTVFLFLALFVATVLSFLFARRNQKRTGEDVLQRREYEKKKKRENLNVNRTYRRRIVLFMVFVMLVNLYSIFSATYRWGNAQLQNEAEKYESELQEWINKQKGILDMFVSTIAADPDMLEDYDRTISYLDGVTRQFPEISASYLSNPDHDPSVYMNNGWIPDPGIKIEERPWYIDSMMSKSGWTITTPYYDEQTGSYCITIAEQVHDVKTDKFLGVFGIDFYMDKLIEILGSSYSDRGYAFLVDVEGYIINHPYGKYQMTKDSRTSVLELPYGKVRKDGMDTRLIRDYDGTTKILLATVNETSQFSVYVVSDMLPIYGRVILYSIITLSVFLVCIILIYQLLSGMITWQNEVNQKLEKAAQTDLMTGLLNKASVEEEIAQAVKVWSGAFMIVDLDNFKLVNDLYSHEMGDRLLVRFASLIQSVIRDNDIAGRIGGDEFIVFCEGLTDEETIKKKIRFLNDKIIRSAKEYMGNDMEIPIGCSAGVSLVPRDGNEYSTLFAKADLALHEVKRGSKHNVMIYSDEGETKAEEGNRKLSNLQMIFGERNIEKSALVTDREMFQSIYKYMERFASVNGWDLYMTEFIFETSNEEKRSEYIQRFIDVAANLLRNCDVILKYNNSQVILLLMVPENSDVSIPINRVMEAWDKEDVKDVTITCQHEQVNTR